MAQGPHPVTQYVHAAAARNRLKALGWTAFLGTTHLVATRGSRTCGCP